MLSKNQSHSRRGQSQRVVAGMSTASTVLVLCLLVAAPSGAQAFGSSSGRMAVNLKQARPVREGAGICRVEMSAASRRGALAVLVGGILSSSQAVSAKAKQQTGGTDLDIAKLKIGLKGLNDLLDNWDEQTTLCNFAEVQKELLEQKNKAALLEAAKTNALFNKEVSMIVKCKRNPVPIRTSMGFDDFEHPLYGSPKTVEKCRTRVVDPDALEDYIEAEERWNEIYSSAKTMSYSAQMRAAELPVFKKGEEEEKDPFSRERRELVKARDTLKVIVGALSPAS